MKYTGPKQREKRLGYFCINNVPKGGLIKVEYLYTIDGDTAYFKVGEGGESVRFYLINTPELYNNEPYALEAREYTEKILSSAKEIYIQSDVNNLLRDKTESRRILAWVWVDKELLNYKLVREGYATVKYVYSEKSLCYKQLMKAEALAKKEKLRIHEVV